MADLGQNAKQVGNAAHLHFLKNTRPVYFDGPGADIQILGNSLFSLPSSICSITSLSPSGSLASRVSKTRLGKPGLFRLPIWRSARATDSRIWSEGGGGKSTAPARNALNASGITVFVRSWNVSSGDQILLNQR